MTYYNTCRFCKQNEDEYGLNDSLLQYGTRHYAHFNCYLEAGKTLDKLSSWQANSFPYFLLKKYNLLSHPKLRRTEQT